jgi:hypothetical protein
MSENTIQKPQAEGPWVLQEPQGKRKNDHANGNLGLFIHINSLECVQSCYVGTTLIQLKVCMISHRKYCR